MLRSRFLKLPGRVGVVLVLMHFCSTISTAQVTFDFTRVADTSTVSPNDGQLFQSLGAAVIDGDRIAFNGSTSANNGIFTSLIGGTVQTVIDENNLFFSPGASFGRPSISGDEVAFFVNIPGPGAAPPGIFVQDISTNNLRSIATTNTQFPGSATTFTRFSGPLIDNGVVAFTGSNSFAPFLDTVFVDNGSGLTTVVDVGNFNVSSGANISTSGVIGFAIDGNDLYFSTITDRGLYVARDDGSIDAVVSGANATIPLFSQIFGLSASNGNIAFDAGNSGIGQIVDGLLSLPVTGNTPIPNTNDTFALLEEIALDGEDIAFFATNNFTTGNVAGLYTLIDGEISTLLQENDLLDGQVVSDFSLNSESFSDGQIVFNVDFADGSEAIYLATVSIPEPTGLIPVALCLLPCLARRYRKSV